MQRRLVVVTLAFVLLNVALCIAPSRRAFGFWREMRNYRDALVAPDLPNRSSDYFLESAPAPGYYETSEYMIGSVAVGIVSLESNGAIDPSTEDWTSAEESQVASETQVALDWWSSQNPNAFVSFTRTVNYRVPTSYEPINRPQSDQGLWISQAMSYLGYPGASYFTQVRNYVNALRSSAGTNWAFAMFVVDSSNDPDGKFADGTYFAYAYPGGPFLVMTYDNYGWGIYNMDRVTAHETGHIFYATDEYDGTTEYSGYLNIADDDGSGALMDTNEWWLSSGTEGQIGWRDSDADTLQDIVDTFPDTVLNPYSTDPTNRPTLTYGGLVSENPYPNNNPHGTGRDVTINKIASVESRVDDGTWRSANAVDGAFDEAEESFFFTTSSLSVGTHYVETRGINSVGNIEESPYASDEVTRAWAVVYVPTDYSTIQEAVEAAYLGDDVAVSSGVYHEHVTVTKTLLLSGEDKSTTIIEGYGSNVETCLRIYSNSVRVHGFTIRNWGWGLGSMGIDIRGDNNVVDDNVINGTSEGYNGISLLSSKNNSIRDNIITSVDLGISIEYSTNNTISRNNMTENGEGIFVRYSSNNTLSDNNIRSNSIAFELSESSDIIITNNNMTNEPGWGVEGFYVVDSFNCTLSGNIISDFDTDGIYFDHSFNITLRDNTFLDNYCSFFVDGNTPSHYIHDIDTSNTVNSKPIYYWVNRHDDAVPSDAGCVVLVNSTRIIVRNVNVTRNGHGVFLICTNNSMIIDNNIANNWVGIDLNWSANNTISGNSLVNNDYGVAFDWSGEGSSNNKIFHNNFINNGFADWSHVARANTWDDGYPSGGNYWSAYAGVDVNNDGIGDTPYFYDNYPLMNPYIAGDIDYDGIVDQSDVSVLAQSYGTIPESPNWNARADNNNDDIINVRDLYRQGKNYGKAAQAMRTGTTQIRSSTPVFPIFIILSMLLVLKKESGKKILRS